MGRGRVVVAMSGGVDSSVVAGLMKQEGYEVVGVTLQLYDYGAVSPNTYRTCCASKDIKDAEEVARTLGIQHYVINYESVFKREVMEDFASSYMAGFTPVPCVKCNQTVKFRDLYDIARKLDAKFLATGHYVRDFQGAHGKELHRGDDVGKDQSYFLFKTTWEQMQYLHFPLGGKTKQETRKLAETLGLKLAAKPDSQDICFVPNGDYAGVIEKLKGPEVFKKGEIICAETGRVLGEHNGTIRYTVGQRRGIGVSGERPLYVVKIEAENAKIYIGEEKFLFKKSFKIEDFNFIGGKAEKMPEKGIYVRVRSSSAMLPCVFEKDSLAVNLLEPTKLISPGQACVFYIGSRTLGGGFIKKVLD